jgi:hypothetical protein
MPKPGVAIVSCRSRGEKGIITYNASTVQMFFDPSTAISSQF